VVDFGGLASAAADFPHWALLMERLAAREMPPKPIPPPPAQESQKVIAWIHEVRAYQIKNFARDPRLHRSKSSNLAMPRRAWSAC